MKKFKFSLDTMLRVRLQQEKVLRKELFDLVTELEVIEQQIAELREEMNQITLQQHTQSKTRKSIDDFMAYSQYYAQLQDKVDHEIDQTFAVKNRIGAKKKELEKALQERKQLDKLKEKQFEEWKKEVENEENKFLDEIATTQYMKESGRS